MSKLLPTIKELLAADFIELDHVDKTAEHFIFSIVVTKKAKTNSPMISEFLEREISDKYSIAVPMTDEDLIEESEAFEPGHPDYGTGQTVSFLNQLSPIEVAYNREGWVVYNHED